MASVCLFPVAVILGGGVFASDTTVRVSDFGFDEIDSTRFIEQAITSGARRVILDRQAGPWYTLPLKMRSNLVFELESGVELVAKRGAYKGLRDFLFWVDGVTNVVVRGGPESAFRMWKRDYQGPAYQHGEWRYALKITRSENVLVEGLRFCDSGGDGIGVSGRNITIRNCVCDNNHRQGISVFDVDGLVIEDTVLSNTQGTPPQSGIDFEPDRGGWKLSNILMRSCRFENNLGCGIEIHLARLDADSPPISMRFENCRTIGNGTSFSVFAGAGNRKHVRGTIAVTNCVFESALGSGISLRNKTADSFGISFSRCSVSNAASAAVSLKVSVSDLSGPPDGIDFGDLTIYTNGEDGCFRPTRFFGRPPREITGELRIVGSNGVERSEKIDAEWIGRRLPVWNDGELPPPRVPYPRGEAVSVVDDRPGELVALEPVVLRKYNRRYVFFVDVPGEVRFVGRQLTSAPQRSASGKRLLVQYLGNDGRSGKAVHVGQPGFESAEFCFKAKNRGFYLMTVPRAKTGFMLEQSSVPVAIDVSERGAVVAGFASRPFSLRLWGREAERFLSLFGGSDYSHFRCQVFDPEGGKVLDREDVCDLETFRPAPEKKAGLWRIDFGKSPRPHYDSINLDLTGGVGAYFLSGSKYWKY